MRAELDTRLWNPDLVSSPQTPLGWMGAAGGWRSRGSIAFPPRGKEEQAVWKLPGILSVAPPRKKPLSNARWEGRCQIRAAPNPLPASPPEPDKPNKSYSNPPGEGGHWGGILGL